MPAPQNATVEHHALGPYRLSFGRELGVARFTIHGDDDRRVAKGMVGLDGVMLRFEDPERDQTVVTPLCPRIAELWSAMQVTLIAESS